MHTKDIESIINKYEQEDRKILYRYVCSKLNTFLINNQITIKNLLLDDISRMNWRASQPIGEGVPQRLQLCEQYNIGFCGDWIQTEGFGTVSGAILSGLNLSNKFIEFY